MTETTADALAAIIERRRSELTELLDVLQTLRNELRVFGPRSEIDMADELLRRHGRTP